MLAGDPLRQPRRSLGCSCINQYQPGLGGSLEAFRPGEGVEVLEASGIDGLIEYPFGLHAINYTHKIDFFRPVRSSIRNSSSPSVFMSISLRMCFSVFLSSSNFSCSWMLLRGWLSSIKELFFGFRLLNDNLLIELGMASVCLVSYLCGGDCSSTLLVM